MKAITIRNPWAWAIARGIKAIENRTWRTNYRGDLAIHAASRPCERGLVLPDGTPVIDAELVYGAVIAVVELIDCVPLADVSDDPFAVGPWCWLLGHVRAVTPISLIGQLSLWDVPDRLISGQTV